MSGRVQVMKQMNINELRSVLTEQIDKLRRGKVTAPLANAMNTTVSAYMRSIKLDMDYHRMIGKTPSIAAMLIEGEAGSNGQSNGQNKKSK